MKKQNTLIIRVPKKSEKGFTLIETIFSLLIVFIALIFICKTLIFSIYTNRNSLIRFEIIQKYEYYKYYLYSKSFNSNELKKGDYSKHEKFFKINWTVKNITTSLKKIKIKISYKNLTKQNFIYKSKFIKEIKNE